MVFLEVLAMFKRIQYTFAFFLCLTMLICLLPAAYADGLSDLQDAIAGGAGSYTLTESLTIPAGLELGEIQTTLIVPNGITLTIAGGDSGSGRRELSVGDLDIQSGGSVVIENNALLEVSGDLTLNGQLTIGEHSELYITDQDEALVYSSNIIRQSDFSHIVVHYYPDDEDELPCMFDGETGLFYGAKNLPDYAHGNIHVRFDWEMGSDFKSGKTDFHFHAPVTIGKSSSSSLGNLYVDGPLTVEGTLSVGNLHAWSGSELVFAQESSVTVSKSFDLQGSLWVPDTIKLSDLCLDPGKLAVLSYDDGGCLYVNAGAGSELRNAFLEACDQLYAEPATFVIPEGNIINLLYTSVNIPGNLTVFAIGSGFRISDAPFSVEGELICSSFTMMTREGTDSVSLMIPGSMYVERNFQLGSNCRLKLDGELSVEHDAFDPNALVHGENFFPGQNSLLDVSFNMLNEQAVLDELNAQVQPFGNFRRSIWVHFPWTLTNDVTVPAQVRLCVPYGKGYEGSLLIPADKSLTIPAGSELYARGAGPETQQAVVEVRGEIVNNGSIVLDWGDTLGDIALVGSGSISGSGSIIRDGRPYDLVEEQALYAKLTAACAVSYNKPTEYEIEGTHVFTIRDNLTIPANLSVSAIDSTFEVTSSGYFTIAGGGELIAGSLESFGSTAVIGSLHLERDCRILENPVVLNGELVMTLDAWVNLMEFINAPNPDAVAERFSFGDDSLLDIRVEPNEESISDSLDFPMFHIPHIRETYCVTFLWELDRDRELQQDTCLLFHYDGDATGMLIIPEGMTLTIPEGSELMVRSAGLNGEAAVLVMGVLINNGSIDLTEASDLALVNGGVYSGGGTVRAAGAPCVIRNDPANADIRLPVGLETLESEALADGDFFSVYIPAGTASIATDAFGDKEALIVYGVPGSEAESFAHSKSFLFAPVA